jgi:DNA-directed RNA polymerase subunit RPC12/RpoP
MSFIHTVSDNRPSTKSPEPVDERVYQCIDCKTLLTEVSPAAVCQHCNARILEKQRPNVPRKYSTD